MMLPLSYIDTFLERTPRPLQDIVYELRNLIASVAPRVTEAVLWKGISYYDKERGGPVSAGICQIGLEADHVRLGFVHGAFLPDPSGLLEGDRKAKRYVRIPSYEAAPWEDLKALIAASTRFDPYTQTFRKD